MNMYISPILGEVQEEIYNHTITYKNLGFQNLLNIMRREFGYGFLRTGVMFLETEFDEPREFIGAELNAYLLNKGLSSSQSESLIKLFFTNQSLIDDVVETGFSINDVVYGLDLKGRLNNLGLESRTRTVELSMKSTFTIYPLLEIPEYIPPPPPEEEIWRPFEMSMLIDCETGGEGKTKETRKIEFRGTFIAEKNSIIDWEKYTQKLSLSQVRKLLRDAGLVAEAIVFEYASQKGYDFLFDCSEPDFNGFNPMEDAEDIKVQIYESEEYETITNLEVIDIDYERTPFTDQVIYKGHWWKDENKSISEMRKQVTGTSRW